MRTSALSPANGEIDHAIFDGQTEEARDRLPGLLQRRDAGWLIAGSGSTFRRYIIGIVYLIPARFQEADSVYFFDNVSQNPTLQQRSQLVEEIKVRTPTTAFETAYAWFYNARRSGISSSSNSINLGFTNNQLDTLRTLLKPLPQPPSEIVEVWAKLLNLGVEVVVEMITAIRKENQAADSNQVHHLPTPGMSTSPEPNREDAPTDPKHEPSISPTIPFREPPLWPVWPGAATILVPGQTVSFQPTAVLDRDAASAIAAKKHVERSEILEILQQCLQPLSSYNSETKVLTSEEVEQAWLAYSEPIIKLLW
ncbi:hypothetical protein EYR40_007173 [Pleurotus pulmonarius]|nr:hypothetical protein EYR36_003545 [Pleurotus pulmonarius]KAF4600067.1 hypothetical protein EYR40_007173 [Pleurotus pulmonarius]